MTRTLLGELNSTSAAGWQVLDVHDGLGVLQHTSLWSRSGHWAVPMQRIGSPELLGASPGLMRQRLLYLALLVGVAEPQSESAQSFTQVDFLLLHFCS